MPNGGAKLPSGKGSQSRSGSDHRNEAQALDRNLTNTQMEYPRATQPAQIADGSGNGEFRGDYQPLSRTYSYPTHAKKKWQFKEVVKHSGMLAPDGGAGGQNAILNWSPTDRDMDAIETMWQELQDRDFEDWLGRAVDLRQPGRLQYMHNLFPELIDKQITALHREHDLQMRKQKLKAFGPQTRDDYLLKYLLETNRLQDQRPETATYIPGFLAPRYHGTDWHGFGPGSAEPAPLVTQNSNLFNMKPSNAPGNMFGI